MNYKMKSILLVVASLLFINNYLIAQTSIDSGEIIVIWNQSDSSDDFAFVTLKDLQEGTVIYFTDCGADTDGFNSPCTEGAFEYTVPNGGLSTGEIIFFNAGVNTDFEMYNDTRITGSYSNATSGDQIIVFQDADNPGGSLNAANNPKFIFISNNASTQFNGDKTDSNQTGLPLGLQNSDAPFSALGLGSGPGVQDEFDNTVYNGPYVFDTVTDARLALSDPANYYKTNVGPFGGDSNYDNFFNSIPDFISFNTLYIDNVEIAANISVYPNPTSGSVNIAYSNLLNIRKATLLDLTGRKLEDFEFTNVINAGNSRYFKIDIQKHQSGLFLLILDCNEGIQIIKKISLH